MSTESEPFGIYVHVPFCRHRCDYCAFATWADRAHLIDDYVEAVVADIARTDTPLATSVFVGGGTPSLLSGTQMGRILDSIARTADAEVTVECNPDTVSAELFRAYVDHGVNRVSFGVQSMVDEVLLSLGRTHDRSNVERGVELVRSAGLTTFNLDLIYGAAGETVEQWTTTLDRVLALDPPHVSAYALTVEAGTPLAKDPSRFPDEDDQADKYEVATERFDAAGLRSYEISNWARPGHECAHNQLYWRQGDYLGFGCAAHSHRRQTTGGSRRWWNVRTPERYIEALRRNEDVVTADEVLTPDVVALEGLQLALRMADGVPFSSLSDSDTAEFVDSELIERHRDRIVLTPKGRLLANTVAVRLVAPDG